MQDAFRRFCEALGMSIIDIPELNAEAALTPPAHVSQNPTIKPNSPSPKLKETLRTSPNRLQDRICQNIEMDSGWSADV
jgi:hypothetical protein